MTDRRRPIASFCALAVLAVLTLPLGALAQEIRLGSEFRVNSHILSLRRIPAAAARPVAAEPDRTALHAPKDSGP